MNSNRAYTSRLDSNKTKTHEPTINTRHASNITFDSASTMATPRVTPVFADNKCNAETSLPSACRTKNITESDKTNIDIDQAKQLGTFDELLCRINCRQTFNVTCSSKTETVDNQSDLMVDKHVDNDERTLSHDLSCQISL
jgi:hypothetical protein